MEPCGIDSALIWDVCLYHIFLYLFSWVDSTKLGLSITNRYSIRTPVSLLDFYYFKWDSNLEVIIFLFFLYLMRFSWIFMRKTWNWQNIDYKLIIIMSLTISIFHSISPNLFRELPRDEQPSPTLTKSIDSDQNQLEFGYVVWLEFYKWNGNKLDAIGILSESVRVRFGLNMILY